MLQFFLNKTIFRSNLLALNSLYIRQVLAVTEHVWPERLMVPELWHPGMRPPRPAKFPPWDAAWDFIHDRCLAIRPEERISAEEAVEELERLREASPSEFRTENES